MTAVILAAGYVTRLHPLTRDFPKPLIDVGGRSLLDHMFDQIDRQPLITRVFIVTNHRFAPRFDLWRQSRVSKQQVSIIDDGTTTNDDRLGALGDLRLALDRGGIDGDVFVCAADNLVVPDGPESPIRTSSGLLFPLWLDGFVSKFRERRGAWVCAHHIGDIERRRRTGIAVIDDDDRVVEFAEKPAAPKSGWAIPPLYLYDAATVARLGGYLAEGGSPDAPGSFVEWLCSRRPVYAHKIKGVILDIGTPQSLEAARARLDGGRR